MSDGQVPPGSARIELMAAKAPAWTQEHQDAHDALVSMKVPKKEARKLVEGLPADTPGNLLFAALRARSQGRKPVAGGPQSAVPLHPPAVPLHPPVGGQAGVPAHPPPKTPITQPPTVPGAVPTPRAVTSPTPAPKINLRAFTPAQQQPQPIARPNLRAFTPNKAPSMVGAPPVQAVMPSQGPAQAQVAPHPLPEKPRFRVQASPGLGPGVPAGDIGEARGSTRPLLTGEFGTPPAEAPPKPPTKPLIRVRTAKGEEVPFAPGMGGSATAQLAQAHGEIPEGKGETAESAPGAAPAPQAEGELPEIATEEEYAKLKPGQRFRWMAEGPHKGKIARAHMREA